MSSYSIGTLVVLHDTSGVLNLKQLDFVCLIKIGQLISSTLMKPLGCVTKCRTTRYPETWTKISFTEMMMDLIYWVILSM